MSAPEPMTEAELQAAEARANAATPGPWSVCDSLDGPHAGKAVRVRNDEYLVADTVDFCGRPGEKKRYQANAAFIANARQDVPRLVATVRRERARADAAEAKLARIAALPIMGAQLTLHDLENGLWPRVVRLDDINAVLAEGKA